MVRRMAPFGPPAAALALAVGLLLGGWNAAWSAALGVVVVALNFVAHGLSLAWAAGVSITALGATAVTGFVVRLGVIFALLVWLDGFGWFSPLAFGLAVVPATVVLLAFEMRLLARTPGTALALEPARRRGRT